MTSFQTGIRPLGTVPPDRVSVGTAQAHFYPAHHLGVASRYGVAATAPAEEATILADANMVLLTDGPTPGMQPATSADADFASNSATRPKIVVPLDNKVGARMSFLIGHTSLANARGKTACVTLALVMQSLGLG